MGGAFVGAAAGGTLTETSRGAATGGTFTETSRGAAAGGVWPCGGVSGCRWEPMVIEPPAAPRGEDRSHFCGAGGVAAWVAASTRSIVITMRACVTAWSSITCA